MSNSGIEMPKQFEKQVYEHQDQLPKKKWPKRKASQVGVPGKRLKRKVRDTDCPFCKGRGITQHATKRKGSTNYSYSPCEECEGTGIKQE
jgi:DnaJ-class molecular chaperone